MALTDKSARALPPGRHADGKGTGLMLLVRETGSRLWVQRLRIAGKVRELGHGAYPRVSLADARRAADAAKRAADAGSDPMAAKRARKAPPPGALADAMEGYLLAHAPAWRSPKTARLFRASLERHAAELLRRPASDVTLEDVRAVLSPVWTTKPVLAQKVRSRLEGILEFATAAGWRSGPNPAAWRGVLRPLLARPSSIRAPRHHPALPWERVPAFVAELGDHGGVAARCLELTILTAVRSGEARRAMWEDVDLAAGVWTIPAARMKAGREHRVPLAAPALALMRGLLPAEGKPAGLLFPTRRGTALSDMALLKVVRTMDTADTTTGGAGWRDANGDRITPHGFRSAFRSWCGDTGQPRELAELSLAHRLGDATEQAYARSDLLDRRRALMSAWGAHCWGDCGGVRAGAASEPDGPALRAIA